MYNLKIISSSVRPTRKGPVVARWIENIVKETTVLNVELERAMQKILQESEKEFNQKLIRGDYDRILRK